VNPSLVNRRGIYKDVYGSIEKYTEYQFRPNICIAMSYAPELFEQEHAAICLQNVVDILMEKNCMGIKTLDPKDKQYNGDYVNSDASHGWNYHQGPEWVWPVGFFLKAQLIFKEYSNSEEELSTLCKEKYSGRYVGGGTDLSTRKRDQQFVFANEADAKAFVKHPFTKAVILKDYDLEVLD
jgi:glycogen debranching enzyme